MGKRMRVDGMHTWSFPSGLLHIQTIYWMCPPRKRSFIASCFEDVKCYYTIIYFTLFIKITCKISPTSCELEGRLYIPGIEIKSNIWLTDRNFGMSKENKSNAKLFVHQGILTDRHSADFTIQYINQHFWAQHNSTYPQPTSLLRKQSGNRPLFIPPVCPPETDYLDQSAKWLDLLGTLEWPSTSTCQASRPVGFSPSESTH